MSFAVNFFWKFNVSISNSLPFEIKDFFNIQDTKFAGVVCRARIFLSCSSDRATTFFNNLL